MLVSVVKVGLSLSDSGIVLVGCVTFANSYRTRTSVERCLRPRVWNASTPRSLELDTRELMVDVDQLWALDCLRHH